MWQAGSSSCSIWDLVPWSGIEPGLLALWAWSLSNWITRGSPLCCFCRVKWNTNTQVIKRSVLFFTESDLLCSIIEMIISVKPKEYGTFIEENFKLKEFFSIDFILLPLCVAETASWLPSQPIFPSSLTQPQFLVRYKVSMENYISQPPLWLSVAMCLFSVNERKASLLAVKSRKATLQGGVFSAFSSFILQCRCDNWNFYSPEIALIIKDMLR